MYGTASVSCLPRKLDDVLWVLTVISLTTFLLPSAGEILLNYLGQLQALATSTPGQLRFRTAIAAHSVHQYCRGTADPQAEPYGARSWVHMLQAPTMYV